jgi:hypothetical protein
MLAGKAVDVKRHRWFDGLNWEALAARKLRPPRLPHDDSAKRLRELAVRLPPLPPRLPLLRFPSGAGMSYSGVIIGSLLLDKEDGQSLDGTRRMGSLLLDKEDGQSFVRQGAWAVSC